MGWSKLGDETKYVPNGVNSDIWILANAPYMDAAHDYVSEIRNQAGVLGWHGGNYMPGTNDFTYWDAEQRQGGDVLKFETAREVFKLL